MTRTPIPADTPMQQALDTFSLATPYGVLAITNHGRTITFTLHEGIRHSEHSVAIYNYVQQLKKRGITRFNNDHIPIPGANRAFNLARGRAKLDIIYYENEHICEAELKTTRQLGIDRTQKQLVEMAHSCSNLILVVPRQDYDEALTILRIMELDQKIKVDTYDITPEEEID